VNPEEMRHLKSGVFKDFSASQEISAMYLLTKRDNSVARNGSADVRPKESPAEQSQDDIRHYQKIVVALGQSIDLMAKIDAAIPNWPLDAEYN
jgi:hypothetical protein